MSLIKRRYLNGLTVRDDYKRTRIHPIIYERLKEQAKVAGEDMAVYTSDLLAPLVAPDIVEKD